MGLKHKLVLKMQIVRCVRLMLRMLVVFVLLILLLPSFRNMTLPIPNAWHPLSTLELMKALKLYLATPAGDNLAALSVCSDPHLFDEYHTYRTSSTKMKYKPRLTQDVRITDHINNTELYERAYSWVNLSEKNWRKFSPFLPLISISDKMQMIETWRTIHEVCERLNIPYFFMDGSVMGVIRHRGVIPWDDDIDLGMDVKHLDRLQHALSCVPGYTLRVQRNLHWKFFPDDARISPAVNQFRTFHSRIFSSAHEAETYALEYEPFDDVVMRFPFVDIFFTTSDGKGFTWALNSYTLPLVYIRDEDLYPLAFLPFEGYLAPVPHKSHKVMGDRYAGLKKCVSPSYNHSAGHSLSYIAKILCKDLADMYFIANL